MFFTLGFKRKQFIYSSIDNFHKLVLENDTQSTIKVIVWTCIFHMCSHSIDETHFYWWKKLILEKSESLLILLYFKRENKTRKKTLKKWLHSFWKNVTLKNPSLGSGIRLPIGKVPLRGSTSLSPKEVLLAKLRELGQLIGWLRVPR